MPSALRPLSILLLTVLGAIGSASHTHAQDTDLDQLVGHAAAINSAIYAPDGSLIATAAADQLIKLWDPVTGKEVRTLQGHTAQVLSLTISPDGRTLISGAGDNTLRQWDLPRTDPLHTFEGHAAPLRAVVIDPQGRQAVTAGVDKSLRLWDLEAQKITAVWQGHQAEVTRLAYRADGNEIASADSEGNILLWNILTGKPLAEITGHTGEVTGLAYHPNNQQLFSTGADGLLQTWQLPVSPPRQLGEYAEPLAAVALTGDSQTALLATGTKLQLVTLSTGAVLRELEGQTQVTTSATISPNNALVAAANENGSVLLWNLADGTPLGTIAGHAEPITDVAIAPDSTRLATAGTDGTIRLWHLPTAALPLTGHTADCLASAVDPQGKFLATAGADNTIRLFNPTTGAATGQLTGHAAAVTSLAPTADGKQLSSGDTLGEVQRWNIADGANLTRLGAHAGAITAVAQHPQQPLLVTAGVDRTLKAWSLPTPPALPLLGHAEAVSAVEMSADGSLLLAGGADKIVRSYDAQTGDVIHSFAGATEAITALELLEDSTLLAAGTADGSLRFWQTADGTPWQGPPIEPAPDAAAEPPENLTPASLLGHTGAIHHIDHHAESERLATAGADGTVRLWRLPTAPERLAESIGPTSHYIVSTDGTKAALAGMLSERPALFVIDLSTGELLQTLLGHAAAISSTAFNAEGTQLASVDAEHTIRVWDLADAKFPQQQLLPQTAAVTALAFNSDSTQLLVASADNAIHRWSLVDGEEVDSLAGHTGAIAQLLVRGDTLFSAAADSTVRSWNLTTGAAIRSVNHGSAVNALAVSADATVIASAGADNSIKLFNAADGSALGTLTGHATPVNSLSFSDEGSLLVSGSATSQRLWHVATGVQLQSFPLPEWPLLGVRFAQLPVAAESAVDLTKYRLASAGTDGSLRIYRPDMVSWLPAHEGEVSGVQFLPDGKSLVTAAADNTIVEWDLATGKAVRSFAGPTDAITSISLTADGTLLAAGCADQQVYLYDMTAAPAANAPLPATQTIEYAAPVNSVRFSVNGQRLAIGLANHVVHLRDIPSGRELQRFFGHTEAITSVALSTDGQTLLSGSADKTARRWTVSAQIIAADDQATINDLAFTADGSRLIAASEQAALSVWPLDASAQIGEPTTIPPATSKSETWPAAAKRRVSIAPDASQLAVLAVDGTVARWDMAAGAMIDVIEPLPPTAEPAADATEPAPVGDLAYSSEGTLLAIGSGQHVRVHDVASARQLEILSTPTAITSLALTPENQIVLTSVGMQDNAALHSMALEKWWPAHEGPATALAFSTEGDTLLSGGAEGKLTLWNLAEGTSLRSYSGATGPITDVTLTPDNTRAIASSTDRMVRVWPLAPAADAETAEAGRPLLELEHPAAVRSLSISADNQRLVTAADDPTIRLWDLTLGKQVQRWPVHAEQATAVVIGADNKTIVSGGTDSAAYALQVNLLRSLAAHEGPIADFALYNNGTQAATAGDTSIRLWNLADGSPVREIAAEVPFTTLAMRADNAQLVAADAENKLHLLNPTDGSETTSFELASSVTDLAYSADSEKIVATAADGPLRFFAPADGALLYELASAEPLTSLAIAPDSRRVVTTGSQGAVALWSYASPEATRTLTGHGGNVYATAFSPDGTLIASASADQTIRLWDAATGTQKSQLTGHEGPVFSLAFSPDGALLVSCGADQSIRLWDVLGGRQLKQLPVGDSTLYSVAYHPGGKLVAAAGVDKKIYVYDVLAGTLESTLTGHTDYIYRVTYNEAGNRLLSCGYGGNVIVWNAANGEAMYEKALGEVSSFADYGPENDRVIVAGGDGRARFLQLPATVK